MSSVHAQRLEPPPVHRPGDQTAIGLGEFGELGIVDRVPPRDDQDGGCAARQSVSQTQ
ncbi:hypothetical protein [Streptomyces canus]|uniref:hypothetical protein n=1 Tax=Streptomyces canus TaxID=58343 RepID=UPI002780D561|nr:hypothetical protein [Streptomyces canus]MDQ1068230.1 hypothetical protein [Streptomyces canus]